MKKYIYIPLVLMLLFSACSDKLQVDPLQNLGYEPALSSSANIQNLLRGGYERTGRNDYQGGYLQVMADLLGASDEVFWHGTWAQPQEIFNKEILVNNSFILNFWQDAYAAINITNLVVDHAEIVEESARVRVENEAKFLRGLAYFELVRNFGSQYQAGTTNSQLGVPLVLEGVTDYNINLNVPRNTVEDVYTQVLADLNAAYTNLPASNGVYANKYSAGALLARIYLQQGNYAAARDAAQDVIANSGRALTATYAEAFNTNANSSESLFDFQVTSQGGDNTLITLYADQGNGGRGGDIRITDSFLDLFDSEDDFRSTYFYASRQNGRRLTGKYTNQFANVTLSRLAEMYLIRAEANFRLGTAIGDTPLNDINRIRERAGATAKGAVTLADILLERRLELAFEGFLIHDHKRTGTAVGSLPANADVLVFPIPQRELDVNPNLFPQNPGYGG